MLKLIHWFRNQSRVEWNVDNATLYFLHSNTHLHMTVMGLLPVDIWDLVIMSSISMRVPALGRESRGHSVRWNWVTVKPSTCLAPAGCSGWYYLSVLQQQCHTHTLTTHTLTTLAATVEW